MSAATADLLWRARQSHAKILRDFDGYPTTEAKAYVIQAAMIASCGLDVVGWKIGATVAAQQPVLGVEAPFIGPLFADFVHDNGAEIAVAPGHGLETEFTIRLTADLPHQAAPYAPADIVAAIGAVVPSFEIIGFRFEGEPVGAGLRLIADGGANVGAVFADDVTNFDADALAGHAVTLTVNGNQVAAGTPSDLVWDHLFDAIGWLATQPPMAGRGLKAGDRIMTGTMTGMVPLSPGDVAEADFGAMGKVVTRFV
ncbi:MAG: fumarylacetoacetate hydrolase family protein [Rhodospirillaceae bacterium]